MLGKIFSWTTIAGLRLPLILALLFATSCLIALAWPGAVFKSHDAKRNSSLSGRENEESESLSLDGDEKDDVDAGPLGRGGLSFRDYLQQRERMTELLRGLPSDAAGELRNHAIQLLQQQQASLLGNPPATAA